MQKFKYIIASIFFILTLVFLVGCDSTNHQTEKTNYNTDTIVITSNNMTTKEIIRVDSLMGFACSYNLLFTVMHYNGGNTQLGSQVMGTDSKVVTCK